MTVTTAPVPRRRAFDDSGFTLIELLITMAVLMIVSAMMLRGTIDMTRLNSQQANRSEMHAGIRNATALLQQEVGQAGRVAFPADVTLVNAITAAGDQWVTLGPSLTSVFVGEALVLTGKNTSNQDVEEVVRVLGLNAGSNTIRAAFTSTHAAGAPVRPAGGFAEGVVPTTRTDGSTASVLKIVGDINSDGTLMYVEYTCDWNGGRLYRNMMTYDAGSKPALSVEQVLLDNLLANPPDPDGTPRPCFSYEQRTINGTTYVINVAIMTTVRTDEADPVTGAFQTVTKALLNVSPRNVFNVWQVASFNYVNRVQPLPQSVVSLLP
jgi:prepilin-type N-terminal cleavage/methylation domain-containing protein